MATKCCANSRVRVASVDRDAANHKIFTKYVDVARTRPGQDHSWAIGEELFVPQERKLSLHTCTVADNYDLVTPKLDEEANKNVLNCSVRTSTFAKFTISQ